MRRCSRRGSVTTWPASRWRSPRAMACSLSTSARNSLSLVPDGVALEELNGLLPVLQCPRDDPAGAAGDMPGQCSAELPGFAQRFSDPVRIDQSVLRPAPATGLTRADSPQSGEPALHTLMSKIVAATFGGRP